VGPRTHRGRWLPFLAAGKKPAARWAVLPTADGCFRSSRSEVAGPRTGGQAASGTPLKPAARWAVLPTADGCLRSSRSEVAGPRTGGQAASGTRLKIAARWVPVPTADSCFRSSRSEVAGPRTGGQAASGTPLKSAARWAVLPTADGYFRSSRRVRGPAAQLLIRLARHVNNNKNSTPHPALSLKGRGIKQHASRAVGPRTHRGRWLSFIAFGSCWPSHWRTSRQWHPVEDCCAVGPRTHRGRLLPFIAAGAGTRRAALNTLGAAREQQQKRHPSPCPLPQGERDKTTHIPRGGSPYPLRTVATVRRGGQDCPPRNPHRTRCATFTKTARTRSPRSTCATSRRAGSRRSAR
jgi:hypothetical protein